MKMIDVLLAIVLYAALAGGISFPLIGAIMLWKEDEKFACVGFVFISIVMFLLTAVITLVLIEKGLR